MESVPLGGRYENRSEPIATQCGAKDRKFLRQCLEVEQTRHKTLYDFASKGHAFKEFVVAMVGFEEYAERNNMLATD